MSLTKLPSGQTVEILIVEDSATQAQRLRFLLEQNGYIARLASNGRLGLEAVRVKKPTLIISDVVMPEMDGYELCRSIKADPALSDVPLILVTTLADPQDVIRGIECHADNFLLKPYDEAHLISRIEYVLINHAARQVERAGMAVEIFFNGKKHLITADRLQILNLLLSTYDAAMQRNKELSETQESLQEANSELHQLTQQLETRVASRTTELAEANNALQESEAQTRLIIDTALDAVIAMDERGLVRDWNPQAEQIFGWPRNEALGKSLGDLIIPLKHRQSHNEGIQRFLATGEGPLLSHRVEITALHRDGREFPVELSISPMQVRGSWIFSGFARDITSRKEAEAKLRGQLERMSLLQRITRAIGDRQDLTNIFHVAVSSIEEHLSLDFVSVCLLDDSHNTLTVSRVGPKSAGLASSLGLQVGSIIALLENGLARCTKGELVYEPDLSALSALFAQRLASAGLRALVGAPLLVESRVFGILLAARQTPNSFSSGDCEFLRQLSEHVALAAHQAQLHEALQQAYDDLRQSQQAAVQQERLRALGQMASGIAHDINNAISPVALYTESLLAREPNLSPRARNYLATIQRAIEDVAETVARMREFYRQREPQLELTHVDLNKLVQQILDLTRARWRDVPQERGIVIDAKTFLATDIPRILGADSEIRDALTNLVLNAVDAMPEGGTLTLSTSTNETQVIVEVRDTGVGMDEATHQHCLEPFFTTKGERGSGLGLAMVYGMARRHGGEVEIDSRQGEGTAVRLVFPIARSGGEAPKTSTPMMPQRQRILVVDDDPILIKSLRDILEEDGHLVISADGGQAGISLFTAALARSGPFSLVITDLGMPNVDGRKVAAAVKAASADTPVILLTGWGRHLKEENDIPPHVDRVLSKPPKLQELRTAIAELTNGPTSVL